MFHKKPAALVCHLCGKQYGTRSLSIHVKQCEKNWDRQQQVLPTHLRTPPPDPPQTRIPRSNRNTEAMDRYNEEAFRVYSDARTPCPGCGRRFAPDSLMTHINSCSAGKQKIQGNNGSPSQKPNALVCHLCGQLFGSASLNIHLKTCERQYMIQQERLPPSLRRGEPPPPPDCPVPKNIRNTEAVERYNAEAFQVYNESCLNPCPHCGRSFNVDALLKHVESCAARNNSNSEDLSFPSRPSTSSSATSPQRRPSSPMRRSTPSPRTRTRSRSNSRMSSSLGNPRRSRSSTGSRSSIPSPKSSPQSPKLSSRVFSLDLNESDQSSENEKLRNTSRKMSSRTSPQNKSNRMSKTQPMKSNYNPLPASKSNCPTCGTPFVENAKFCFECGTKKT
eukprot:gb/GECH01011362.1/.p1 GENE.gb/GECH01011362.1/~~gb/GECH01011362.1/.p1  ORF type:complete len:391 (+),score=78.49 gb/GECH01011362.1/:1-1173(+)